MSLLATDGYRAPDDNTPADISESVDASPEPAPEGTPPVGPHVTTEVVQVYKCLRCGHGPWRPRKKRKWLSIVPPNICPKCKSSVFWRPMTPEEMAAKARRR